MTIEGQPKTTQELLKHLKKKRVIISKKLINSPLEGNQKKYTSLLNKAEELSQQIEILTNSIPTAGATGEIGQYTIESTQSPENHTINKKGGT